MSMRSSTTKLFYFKTSKTKTFNVPFLFKKKKVFFGAVEGWGCYAAEITFMNYVKS